MYQRLDTNGFTSVNGKYMCRDSLNKLVNFFYSLLQIFTTPLKLVDICCED